MTVRAISDKRFTTLEISSRTYPNNGIPRARTLTFAKTGSGSSWRVAPFKVEVWTALGSPVMRVSSPLMPFR